jgi:magnesium transporter
MSEKDTVPVSDFMTQRVAYVHAETDRLHVAELALAESIKAVPVVDDMNRFIGIVTADSIIQTLSEEHSSYLYTAVGINKSPQQIFTELSFFEQVKTRIPWLILGLFGGLIGAVIVRYFESSLSEQLFVAAFIPAIVYIADAVGNQTEMLVVRALGRDANFSIKQYLFRELSVGLVISVILAFLILGLSYAWVHDVFMSLTLAIAIIATTLFSIVFTIILPWFLKRLGFDPAVASGPLATVICDVSSVTIYLLIASTLL